MFESMERIVFDVECFPNFFICSLRLRKPSEVAGEPHVLVTERCLEHSERQRGLNAFCRKNTVYVGHNSLGYDNIMVAYWLQGANENQLYQLNNYLIEGTFAEDRRTKYWVRENVKTSVWEKFGHARREHKLQWGVTNDLGWKDRLEVDTLILGEKQGSLKNAAINLGIDDLMEAPVEFGKILTNEEKDLVRAYCFKDVDVTEKLFDHYKGILGVRTEFYNMGIDRAFVVGSAKLAELYLLLEHKKTIGAADYQVWEKAARDIQSKHRDFDPVLDLIGDYRIAYRDSGFSKLWNRLKGTDLLYIDSVLLKGYDVAESEENDEDWVKKMHEVSAFRNTNGEQLPKGDLYFTDDKGMSYQFGMGGLHNIAPRGVWVENAEMCIYNVDVTSYYPSLIYSNTYTPRQFLDFAKILERKLAERKIHKKEGRKIKEQALKLVLNSSFGKTKDKNSIMFDPKCHFSVTISGQLLLLMLIDMVYQISPNATVINANTDGVCFYAPRTDLAPIQAVMRLWEKFAKVQLEDEYYESWAQSACNLYCALGKDGKIKSKGRDFKVYPTSMRETLSEAPATKKAIIECLLRGVHPLETLAKCSVKDFRMSAGFGGKRTLVVDGVPQRGRRALRYAWVKNGSILQKLEKRGLSIVGENRKCQVLDHMNDLERENIDLAYYEEKAVTKVLEIVAEYTTSGLPKKITRNLRENFENWFLKLHK